MTRRLVPSQIRKRRSVLTDSLRLYRRTVPTDPGELSGFPKPLWAWLARRPPPGPFRSHTWRSPLRGPWLTSVFALVLLVGLPIVTVTGLL